jgi:hypothetical protein
MRRIWIIIFIVGFVFSSCGPKPQYKTREGRKKQKYYNKQQFDHPDRDTEQIKSMKKKNKK